MVKLLHPAPRWKPSRSSHLVLWHGCTDADETAIRASGIDWSKSRWALDFGRGFYTTTLERQARQWAKLRFDVKSLAGVACKPVVLQFRVNRFDLAKLHSLHFVRGHFDSRDFWSLVQRCRRSIDPDPKRGTVGRLLDHRGPIPEARARWYDLVSGPVAAFWHQRSEMNDADQFSFHTSAAIAVLNRIVTAGGPDFRSIDVK